MAIPGATKKRENRTFSQTNQGELTNHSFRIFNANHPSALRLLRPLSGCEARHNSLDFFDIVPTDYWLNTFIHVNHLVVIRTCSNKLLAYENLNLTLTFDKKFVLARRRFGRAHGG